jgi:hypothetical protein
MTDQERQQRAALFRRTAWFVATPVLRGGFPRLRGRLRLRPDVHDAEIRDAVGRPMRLNSGQPIKPLFENV